MLSPWKGNAPDILKQVAATKEQIVQAQRERDRVANLLRVGAANQKQLDDAESLLKVLCKQLAAQNSTLQNSDQSLTWQSSSVGIQVAQVEDQLKKCHIVAPLTGTVLAKYAEAGELAHQVLRCSRWLIWNRFICVPMSLPSNCPR